LSLFLDFPQFFEITDIMNRNTVRILLFLSVCFALNGCGTKGPLYIPEQAYPQATQANK
jgi:predicted small lipoprotein YifL